MNSALRNSTSSSADGSRSRSELGRRFESHRDVSRPGEHDGAVDPVVRSRSRARGWLRFDLPMRLHRCARAAEDVACRVRRRPRPAAAPRCGASSQTRSRFQARGAARPARAAGQAPSPSPTATPRDVEGWPSGRSSIARSSSLRRRLGRHTPVPRRRLRHSLTEAASTGCGLTSRIRVVPVGDKPDRSPSPKSTGWRMLRHQYPASKSVVVRPVARDLGDDRRSTPAAAEPASDSSRSASIGSMWWLWYGTSTDITRLNAPLDSVAGVDLGDRRPRRPRA